MSLLKVITRIIPLNYPSSDLIHANELTDGLGIVKESELTDRNGVQYRIERIQYFQPLESNETPESIKKIIAAKYESIPGLTELKEGEQVCDCSKDYVQVSLPEMLSFGDKPKSSLNASDQAIDHTLLNSVVISLVEPCDSEKKLQDEACSSGDATVSESSSTASQNLVSNQGSSSSKDCVQYQQPGSSSKKNKVSLYWTLKDPKRIKRLNAAKKIIKKHVDASRKPKEREQLKKNLIDLKLKSLASKQTDKLQKVSTCIRSNDSCQTESSVLDTHKTVIKKDIFNQLHLGENSVTFNSLLQSLSSYFQDGECLICGFLTEDVNFNRSLHMAVHIDSSSFNCTCCNIAFADPHKLYQHSLSRIKPVRYECDICCLSFKRRHIRNQHVFKRHGPEAEEPSPMQKQLLSLKKKS